VPPPTAALFVSMAARGDDSTHELRVLRSPHCAERRSLAELAEIDSVDALHAVCVEDRRSLIQLFDGKYLLARRADIVEGVLGLWASASIAEDADDDDIDEFFQTLPFQGGREDSPRLIILGLLQGKFTHTYTGRDYWVTGRMRDMKVPQYIAEFDGGGADAYAALQRLFEFDPVPDGAKATTPLFRRWTTQGTATHATVAWMRALVRLRVRQLGYTNPFEWGAHSCRIGGATDLTSTGHVSPLLLQAKGRWASDIGQIYSRMTRRAQLAASELMYAAKGRDLEELLSTLSKRHKAFKTTTVSHARADHRPCRRPRRTTQTTRRYNRRTTT